MSAPEQHLYRLDKFPRGVRCALCSCGFKSDLATKRKATAQVIAHAREMGGVAALTVKERKK